MKNNFIATLPSKNHITLTTYLLVLMLLFAFNAIVAQTVELYEEDFDYSFDVGLGNYGVPENMHLVDWTVDDNGTVLDNFAICLTVSKTISLCPCAVSTIKTSTPASINCSALAIPSFPTPVAAATLSLP